MGIKNTFGVITTGIAPLYKKASYRKEMMNQLFFGEYVTILKSKKKWIKVCSIQDLSTGWIQESQLVPVAKEEAITPCNIISNSLLGFVYYKNNKMAVPLGSFLPALNKDNTGVIAGETYRYEGEIAMRFSSTVDEASLLRLTKGWHNVPYMIGGKTIFGVDCSGFAQMVYRQLGVDLPRDAWQQAQEGMYIEKIANALPGDLAFFDDEEQIVHVGILLDNKTIVHAAGTVRIDNLEKKGIVDKQTGKLTHKLSLIKRYWQ